MSNIQIIHNFPKLIPEKQEIGNVLGKLKIDPRKKNRKLTQANHHRRNKHIAEAHHTKTQNQNILQRDSSKLLEPNHFKPFKVLTPQGEENLQIYLYETNVKREWRQHKILQTNLLTVMQTTQTKY